MTEEPGGPSLALLAVALANLVLLTAASWGLSHAPLGAAHTPVALGIATLKASVVAWVFMEVGRASTTVKVVGVTTLVFIALLCGGIAADVALR